MGPKKVLIICLGNTCNSPIAEAVLQDLINRSGLRYEWIVESAAIGSWSVGSRPDERALSVLKKHNIVYSLSARARQIRLKDFEVFNYIIAMDEEDMNALELLKPKKCKAKIFLLGRFGLKKKDKAIKDPFYTQGETGFETTYKKCVRACDVFLQSAVEGKI